MTDPIETSLYWSIHGTVACAMHSPAREDVRWTSEQWKPLVAPGRRLVYQCQYCHGTALHGRSVRTANSQRRVDPQRASG